MCGYKVGFRYGFDVIWRCIPLKRFCIIVITFLSATLPNLRVNSVSQTSLYLLFCGLLTDCRLLTAILLTAEN